MPFTTNTGAGVIAGDCDKILIAPASPKNDLWWGRLILRNSLPLDLFYGGIAGSKCMLEKKLNKKKKTHSHTQTNFHIFDFLPFQKKTIMNLINNNIN